MPVSNYPNGFSQGVNIHDNPIDIRNSNSNVYWVDSIRGSNGNKGTFLKPFATLAYAVTRIATDPLDVIYVAAGHTEAITADTDITASSFEIRGLGTGTDRPAFSFNGATATAAITLSGNNILIDNLQFIGNITNQAAHLSMEASDCIVQNCSFREGSTTGLTFINFPSTGADRCQILNCEFHAPTAIGNYSDGIELGEVNDRIIIDSCSIWGDFSSACIHNPTAKILTNLTISNCTLTNIRSGEFCLELVSACTGTCSRNFMVADAFATTIDPGALYCFECYSNASADKNGRLNPVVET